MAGRSPASESLRALLNPAPPEHKYVSFPPFESYYRRSWTSLFAGKKRQKLDEVTWPMGPPYLPQVSPEARRKRFLKGIDEQVDKTWKKLFVVRRCACCPPSTQPRLCEQGTYAKFKPCLSCYTNVYGSDGPQVYWGMIVDDMKGMYGQIKQARRGGWKFKALVMMGVLKRAAEEYEAAKEGQTLTFPKVSPSERTFVCEVPAPESFGVDGKRLIVIRAPVRLSLEDHIMSEEAITSKTGLVNTDYRMFKVKKLPRDAEYLQRIPRRPLVAREPRALSKLRMSVIAEEVEYPAFTVGQITAYDALSRYASSLAKRYGWESPIYKQTRSVLKQLQSRTDLMVAVSFAHEDFAPAIGDGAAMTPIERRTQRIKVLLANMSKIYERDRKAFGDEILGRRSDLEWINTIVQGILREL
ncbi:hypothetical protein LTR10_020637 [Elasticomyces elasticus]|uniref:Uncharacterized protein n=1 Tax=Exophiala sideris TaxID=1016849 RepID=A0ABR0J9G8_9EURO|nr:hypothetical protein LTR10_020637 [Elasticomyces elasticus]KAK5029988.1 hypothetical protein LTS07_005712 [Exophiala sideris]KAK5031572.1 hypothetical protein LTR13_007561 [Exophiala sideris]KAK5058249.1 hypothetical protein LTR69_006653 [Exophiala sideris]KAK5180179.1 hypothetical protein LTR44_007304 [Eurotiomycetes sp. CCFEE 6388]